MKFFTKHPDLSAGLFTLALFLVGIGLVIGHTGWLETRAHLARVGWSQFGILLMLSLGNYGLRALRWHLFARAMGFGTSMAQNTTHFLAGFALTITPGRVGELVRLRWIKRATGVGMLQSSPMMLGDRAADLAGVALALLVAAAFGFGGQSGVYWVAGGALVLAFLALNPAFLGNILNLGWRSLGRGGRFFARLRQAVRRLSVLTEPKTMISALVLSIFGWLAEAYAFYLLLGWLGADLGFWMAVAIFLFSMLGGGASGMPGGLGGAEAAMVGLLIIQNVPLETALTATVIIRITTLWFALLVGIIVFPIAERKGR